MTVRILLMLVVTLELSACATQTNFTKALETPVKLTKATLVVTDNASHDIIKANVLGLVAPISLVELICVPGNATDATRNALAAFGDAIETIQEVGEAPPDTSYTSYVTQFRKNAKHIKSARELGDAKAQANLLVEEKNAARIFRERCAKLYAADIDARLGPSSTAGPKAGAAAAFFALNELVKAALGIAENAQRQAAMTDTAKVLAEGLERARKNLEAAPGSDFKPFVAYANSDDSEVAAAMARTRLGATISLHRWFVAQEIRQIHTALDKCGITCLGDPVARKNLDDLVTAIDTYRVLATIDTDKILKALELSIKDAQDRADGKASWAQVLDGLLAITDSLSGLNDKRIDYRKSLD